MKQLLAVLSFLALTAPIFAQKPAATPPFRGAVSPSKMDPAEAKAGGVIYLRYCAACHGRTMLGDGPVASGLLNVATDLTTLAAKNGGKFPYDQVAAIIDGSKTSRIHGTPDMPVWGEVFAVTTGTEAPTAEAAVRRITHHVWSRQVKQAPAQGKK